jgi:hypothetical protein
VPTVTEESPAVRERSTGPRDVGEEICHLVDWHDPDTALCGKDVRGYPWNPPWPYCVVCVDIARGLPSWRPTLEELGLY